MFIPFIIFKNIIAQSVSVPDWYLNPAKDDKKIIASGSSSKNEIESIIFALVGIFKQIESDSLRYYKIGNNFRNSF